VDRGGGVFCDTAVLKENATYRVVKRLAVPENRNILKDEIIRLTGLSARKDCPHLLRRIEVLDMEKEEKIVLLTNHLGFGATTISSTYKDRWQIKIFFKTLKQNLRVKTFVGTSANALKIQIWTALIAILLLKYLKIRSRYNWSLSNLVALLRLNLFSYRDLWEWIDKPIEPPPVIQEAEQLALSLV
jgi:IS4 transposase